MNLAELKENLFGGNKLERIWLLAKIEFKLRYQENKLGLLWALIKPLFQLVIYFIAFKIIMRNNIPNFTIFLFAGLIIWQFFMEASSGLTVILKTKKYLYEYSNMSKIEIYLASMISISMGLFFNLLILMLFIYISQIEVGINFFYLPILFIVLFIFSLGVGLILSNLFILIRDISQVWPLVAQLMMWLSPIFFSTEMLSSKIPFITFINPMFGMISNLRNVLMYNTPPDFNLLLINTLHALLAIGVGLLLLNKIGTRASEKL
jgi:ABC-type polysaccharide/polyol phosphate export permease